MMANGAAPLVGFLDNGLTLPGGQRLHAIRAIRFPGQPVPGPRVVGATATRDLRKNTASRCQPDAIHSPLLRFVLELTTQNPDGGVTVGSRHHKRNVLLRGALRKHQRRNSMFSRRTEDAAGSSDQTDHSAAFDRYEVQTGDRCHALHRLLM